ncbi:MAG: multicopper oxidase domain-containing protein [Verrucomicrobiota bacterium]|nr:multicopper oxidase domain-containing protein [Verrucomicrobiota bacterium]
MKRTFLYLAACAAVLGAGAVRGAGVRYELTIAEKVIAPAGKRVTALAINDSIPGPTLRFRVGDVARIRVHNRLPKEMTILHWHGLLVPNAQDGVAFLNTPPIAPGKSHDYEFRLKHAGTYWYHSHMGLQEQRGLYGAIVVEPAEPQGPAVDAEHVVVLSDWTNEHPDEVMRSLRRGDEWYAIRKGNQQSLWGAYRAGALGDFMAREWSRMPPMDISDVAYDAFWVNGSPRTLLPGRGGGRVKLRLINAGAATYFYVNSATGPLTIVAADGMPVRPVEVRRLLMGMGETYDVVVTLPAAGRYEVRATAQDGSGHASMFLGEGDDHLAPDIPKPNPYSMDWMIAGLEKDERSLNAPELPRPLSPYRKLRALASTQPPADAPVREIELRLTGNMLRYTWSFNGKTLKEESTIPVNRGEVLRMKFINDTMMHHPLHLHGHFFRLLNGQGDFAPLKHTVDIPPMARETIEFHANEQGDWIFHCHLLYHMKAGMSRVISYDGQGSGHQPRLDLSHMDPWTFGLEATLQSNLTHGQAGWRSMRHDLDVIWEYGFGDDEYELDLQWRRTFSPDWATLLGYRFTNEHGARDRAFGGVQYRLPLLAEGTLTVDTEGDLRPGLAKTFQLTDRWSFINEIEYDTNTRWEWNSSLEYRINKRFSITGGYHTDHGFGGGILFRW